MKNYLLAAAACLFLVTPASAESTDWYGAVGVGMHFPQTVDAKAANSGLTWEWRAKDDWDGFVRIGTHVDANWRVELEGGYRSGDVKSITARTYEFPFVADAAPPFPIRSQQLTDLNGSMSVATLMINALYDIPLGTPFHPFVGAGIGAIMPGVNAGGTYVACVEVCVEENLISGADNTRPAGQLIAGASWPISDGVELEAAYRYLRGNHITWETRVHPGILAPGSFEGDYTDSSVTLGLRFSFDAI